MTTPTKVHCFFEQSGTFKNEFRKLGIPAEDYDIQNNFGETDHVIDLFAEIENGYDGKPSVFDEIGRGDLIMAFFPCIYFSQMSQYAQSLNYTNYKHLTEAEACDMIIERQRKRDEYLVRLTKFVRVCLGRGLRMIFENPTTGSFLCHYFLKPPTIKDEDRTKRGDYFARPTGYWFWNCEPTKCETLHRTVTERMRINDVKREYHTGECSLGRPMISPDYARNFIADFILGKPLGGRPQQQDLFAQLEGETKCS